MKAMFKLNILRNEVLERVLFKKDLLKIKKRPIDKEINGIIEKYIEIKKARHKTNLFFIYISYFRYTLNYIKSFCDCQDKLEKLKDI